MTAVYSFNQYTTLTNYVVFNMKDFGLVSIITPNYKCGRFVAETIRSVLAQTYTNWEMIIVDDCSPDNSIEVIEPFVKADGRIRLLQNEKNLGAALSRNYALREAKGRWIAFLDSDDLWLPEKLEKQIQFMVDNNYAFTYHEYSIIYENGEEKGFKVSGIRKVSAFSMYTCCWPGCLPVMYDASKIGLIQIKNLPVHNDVAMWLQVVKKTPCYLLPMDLGRYRRRRGSITPPSYWKRALSHYPLFREAEDMNPVSAAFCTVINILGHVYKRWFMGQLNSK